ncbi:MAG: asparagine synthase (glutamine-hydrolyzing) [Campylobacterales bacterium]|nr:asparagine synthase (glutamine-hydrolyzing) [Campylobacterales bacterium]
MCALFGIIGRYDPAQARSALSLLHHRGPDGCAIIEREGLFFAHHRLAIAYTSAPQPHLYDGLLIAFNGEIYNHRDLGIELGHEGASEIALLALAYRRWGDDFVAHLRGMFAIALVDNGVLKLWRDRLGKKPLFYLQGKDFFAFASEIKALRPLLLHVRMNEEALLGYLGYLAPTPPHTFYEGIGKLESGFTARYGAEGFTCKPYYDLLHVKPCAITDEAEATKRLHDALYTSLALRLESAAPMAALLSGGIDSALLIAMAKAQGRELEAYTLGYEGFSSYDERAAAKESAAFLGVRHHERVITQEEFMQACDAVFAALDEPLNDPASVPLYLMFEQIARDGVRVVHSGEGSDELFLGYRQYFEYLDIEEAAKLQHKNWLKKYFRAHFSMNREWEWYKRVFEGSLLFRSSGEKFTDLQKNALLKRSVADNDGLRYLAPWRAHFESCGRDDPADWYTYVDLKQFQAEHFLVKLDRVSMAHSIESRTPFLDHYLAETVMACAPALRRAGRKELLKKVAAPYLNEAILARKKKGFSNPYMEWLIASGELERIVHVNKKTGLFHEAVLREYIERAKAGRFKQHVWGLYVLSRWMERELI